MTSAAGAEELGMRQSAAHAPWWASGRWCNSGLSNDLAAPDTDAVARGSGGQGFVRMTELERVARCHDG